MTIMFVNLFWVFVMEQFQFMETVKSQILSAPLNLAVEKGNPAVMNCSVTPGAQSNVYTWMFLPSGSTNEVTICSKSLGCNRSLTSFEVIRKSDYSLDLRTNSVQSRDAGFYTCNVRVKPSTNDPPTVFQYSAQLIVLEPPTCEVSDQQTYECKNRWCNVSYTGNWAPEISWMREDVLCFCRVYFSKFQKENLSMSADNTPDYTRTWSCPEIVERLRKPANLAVTNGSRVELMCRITFGSPVLNWTFTPSGSSSTKQIYSKDHGLNPEMKRLMFRSSFEYFYLQIESVELMDAGIYSCNRERIPPVTAHLIVLESNPNCDFEEALNNTTGTFHRLWCSVDFKGNWAPIMKWTLDTEDGYPMPEVENITIPNKKVTYILTVVSRFAKKNSRYVCRTFFSKYHGNSVATVAVNVPEYSKIWTSEIINRSTEISIVALVVTIAGIFLLMFVALTVYHVFFKRLIAARHKNFQISFNLPTTETVEHQENYATIGLETIGSEGETLSPDEDIVQSTPETLPGLAYSSLTLREAPRPHSYGRIPDPVQLPPPETGEPRSTGITASIEVDMHTYNNVHQLMVSSTNS